MATYRAIHVAPDGSLQPTRKELAGPPAGHVRIKVEACGVCHSDAGSVHPHPATEAGVVPGHEAAGRIDAIGDGVTGWSVGDQVGVGYLGGHCGVCEQCRRGSGGQLMVVGASGERIEVSPLSLIFGGVTVTGSLTGSSIKNEDNLRFAVQQGISAMIEEASLDDAPAAYARMMSGAARFRMVLNIA